jgi:hypothetical protein
VQRGDVLRTVFIPSFRKQNFYLFAVNKYTFNEECTNHCFRLSINGCKVYFSLVFKMESSALAEDGGALGRDKSLGKGITRLDLYSRGCLPKHIFLEVSRIFRWSLLCDSSDVFGIVHCQISDRFKIHQTSYSLLTVLCG